MGSVVRQVETADQGKRGNARIVQALDCRAQQTRTFIRVEGFRLELADFR
jgi:hypothetical protein